MLFNDFRLEQMQEMIVIIKTLPYLYSFFPLFIFLGIPKYYDNLNIRLPYKIVNEFSK